MILTMKCMIAVALLLVLSGCTGNDKKSDENALMVGSATPEPIRVIEHVQSSISNSRQNGITRAVRKLSDSVVGINVIQIRNYRRTIFDDPFFRQFFPSAPYREKVKSLGSGFIIDKAGHVLSNQHVVNNAAEITITLTDGTEHIADVVGEDEISDIALLKIRDPKNLKPVTFGSSSNVIIGEWAIALGNPFGLFDLNAKPTVTVGVISALDQDFGKLNEHVYKDMIQPEAAINQGNSGGPLANALGQVIGMNTFIFSGSGTGNGSIGLGFAIPSNRLLSIVKELKQDGRVNRNWRTGIEIENLTRRVAKYLGLPSTAGAIISNISKDSVGGRAGLKVYDVILEVAGKKINDTSDIFKRLEDIDARKGDSIELVIYRDKEVFKTHLKL